MNIAYYGTGNLREQPHKCGLGTIYDNNGLLILQPYEQLIASYSKIRSQIVYKKGRRIYLGERIFDDAGKGAIYRTNQRIVYIREPSILWQTAVHIPYVPDVGHGGWAKYWKENGFRECWELPLNEIYYILERKNIGASFLVVISDGKVYSISFPKRNCPDDIWSDLYPRRKVKTIQEGVRKCKKLLKQWKENK